MKFQEFETIQNTIFEMLSDRGFSSTKLDKSTYEEEKQVKYLFEQGNKQILVVISFESGNKEFINSLVRELNQMKIKNCILVIKPTINQTKTISCQSKELILLLRNAGENSVFVEIFNFDELKYNVTKNILVPKHELLSEEETNILLNEYKIKRNQLPVIFDTDPQVRYHGWNEGSVIKITRKNGDIYYRCVNKNFSK